MSSNFVVSRLSTANAVGYGYRLPYIPFSQTSVCYSLLLSSCVLCQLRNMFKWCKRSFFPVKQNVNSSVINHVFAISYLRQFAFLTVPHCWNKNCQNCLSRVCDIFFKNITKYRFRENNFHRKRMFSKVDIQIQKKTVSSLCLVGLLYHIFFCVKYEWKYI